MARNKAPAIGGAEATLKKIDYIEEEAQNIQFAIWSNRPVSARKLLKNLSKEVDDAEGQIMDLYRALSSLERSLEELEELSQGDRNAWDLTMLGLQHLREGNWGAAADCVEGAVASMGKDGLERSLSTLGRHLNEMGELSDIENIALTLVNQGKRNLDSDLAAAAKAFEDAIRALGPVAVSEAASPFLVNSFFMSVGTTWPEGRDHGLMVITLENIGDNNISTMRLAPPVPYGWSATPKMCEIPEIPPEGFIEIGVEIRPSGSFPQTSLLGTSLNITTGYLANYGQLKVQSRVENRTPNTMKGILLDPWMPEGFETLRLPLIENIGPGDVVHVPVETLNLNDAVGIGS
ncbi:MAG: hypothetical protein CMA28_01255 [Euryarchaeota archaeon]|jgi:tetratricopeptide (TPR) repeat protein|nr:hypothetical protein [Euryarchaeota archaeon]